MPRRLDIGLHAIWNLVIRIGEGEVIEVAPAEVHVDRPDAGLDKRRDEQSSR